MKKIMTAFCILVMVLSSYSFAFAEEKPVFLKEASEGAGFLTMKGDELESLRNRDVIADFEQGRICFSKEISNYLLDHCGGELDIGYFNNSGDEAFIYDDYLFVSMVVFSGKDGSVLRWDPSLGSVSLRANLTYPIEKERKLTYYYHEGARGDRKEIEADFDKKNNSVTFDVTDGFRGDYAVFYDDPILTGRTEEKMSLGVYLTVGSGVLLIVGGLTMFFYKKRKNR